MRFILCGTPTVIAMIFSTASFAADTFIYDETSVLYESVGWDGFYIGGQVGYRASQVDWVHNENIGTDEDFSVNPSGFLGTVYVGYQHQFQSAVLGIEASASFGKIEDSQSSGPGAINPNNPRRRTAVLSNLFTVAGKVGYTPHEDWLLYGKFGAAFADIEINHRRISTGFLFPHNEWNNQLGYVLGVGVDYKLQENVSVGIDYSYMNFDVGGRSNIENTNCNGSLCGDTLNDVHMNVIAARLTYHF